MKLCVGCEEKNSSNPFNRTRVELKLVVVPPLTERLYAFNRTRVELKWIIEIKIEWHVLPLIAQELN